MIGRKTVREGVAATLAVEIIAKKEGEEIVEIAEIAEIVEIAGTIGKVGEKVRTLRAG